MKTNTNEAKASSKARDVVYDPSMFEYISRAKVSRIFTRDYGDMPDSIRKENTNNLYVMLNLWLNMCSDMDVDAKYLLSGILTNGIKNTLKDVDEYRLSLLQGNRRSDSNLSWLRFLDNESTKRASIICGFPKRTLLNIGNEYDFWKDFKIGNRECSDRCYSYYLGSALNDIVKDMTSSYKRDYNKFILAPGATVEGVNTYYDKWKEAQKCSYYLRDKGVNIPVVAPYSTESCHIPPNWCEYTTVPKNAFKRRGIAKESVVKQIVSYQIDYGLRNCLLKSNVTLSDQERNQFFAWVGSLSDTSDSVITSNPLYRKYLPDPGEEEDKDLATIDLSSASDSIRAILVVDTVDGDLYEDLACVRSSYVKYKDGKVEESIRSHRWSTMGSAVTFSLESLIFRAIVELAYQYYELFTGDVKSRKSICVYGDDIIVHSCVAPTVIDLLDCFGFTTNIDKTFINGSYRESCGKEYIDGEDVTINFYPRGTSRYSLPELVSLQHKLQPYTKANCFLVECIKQLLPTMTESSVGSDHDDIWVNRYIRKPVRSSWYGKPTEWYTVKTVFYECYRPLRVYKRIPKVLQNAPEEYRTIYDRFGVLVKRETANEDCVFSPRFDNINDVTEWRRKMREAFDCVATRRVGDSTIWHYMDFVTCWNDGYEWYRESVTTAPDITNHTTFSTNFRPVPKDKEDECELLMYLLTIGGGIEHVNNSPYTKPSDMIRDRRSLTCKGTFQISTGVSFD